MEQLAKGNFVIKKANSPYTLNLTNDNTTIPATNTGAVVSYALAKTDFCVYFGAEIMKTGISYTYSISNSNVLYTTSTNSSTGVSTLSITSMPPSVNYVSIEITAKYNSIEIGKATFTCTKSIAGGPGSDAVVYYLLPQVNVVHYSKDGSITPTTMDVAIMKVVGSSLPVKDTSGTLSIYYSYNNTNFSLYNDIDGIDCISISNMLYLELRDNQQNVLDKEQIPLLKDGSDGTDGADGIGYTVFLTNQAQTFSADSTGKITSSQSVSTTIKAYKNATPISVSGISVTATSGMSYTIDEANDIVNFTPTVNSTALAKSGTISISFTADGRTFSLIFSYSKSNSGADGTSGNDATIFYLAPSVSSIIIDSDGNLNPSTVTCKKYMKKGYNAPEEAATMSITYTKDDSSTENPYTSGVSASGIDTCLTFILKNTNGVEFDRQRIPVIRAGKNGTYKKTLYKWVESVPASPSVNLDGWGESPERNNLEYWFESGQCHDASSGAVKYYNWTVYEGCVTIPTGLPPNYYACAKIKFRTSVANQKVVLLIDQRPLSGDKMYCSIDTGVTISSPGYTSTKVEISYTVATVGEHYIELMYYRGSTASSSSLSYNGSARLLCPAVCYACQGIVEYKNNVWVTSTWGNVFVYQTLPDVTEAVYLRTGNSALVYKPHTAQVDGYTPNVNYDNYRGSFASTPYGTSIKKGDIYEWDYAYYIALKDFTYTDDSQATDGNYTMLYPTPDDIWPNSAREVTRAIPVLYMCQRTRKNGIWSDYSDPVICAHYGVDGNTGLTGPTIRLRGEWSSVAGTYSADGAWIDIVYYNGSPYKCIRTHTAAANIVPGTSTYYWGEFHEFKNVATELLLAKFAWIEKLGVGNVSTQNPTNPGKKRVEISASGHELRVYDDNNNLKIKINGEDIPPLASQTTYPPISNMSSSTVDLENVSSYSTNQASPTATKTQIASFTITASNNSVACPKITLKAIARNINQVGNMSCSSSVAISAYKDGTFYDYLYEIGTSSLDNADRTLVIPAGTTFSLPQGTYTLYLEKTITLAKIGYTEGYYSCGANAIVEGTPQFAISLISGYTAIGKNGFRTGFSTDQYFQAITESNGSVSIEMRCGSSGLRIDSTGIRKWYNGGWNQTL